jgi:hypothetical protein
MSRFRLLSDLMAHLRVDRHRGCDPAPARAASAPIRGSTQPSVVAGLVVVLGFDGAR